jgi:hypothetical protein
VPTHNNSVTNWPWCDAPACSGGVGAYLSLSLSALTPAVLSAVTAAAAQKSSTSSSSGAQHRTLATTTGLQYSGETAEAAVTLVMSEWAWGEDYGWKRAAVMPNDSVYTVLLPRSRGVLYYDPLVQLSSTAVAPTPAPSGNDQAQTQSSKPELSKEGALTVTAFMCFLAGIALATCCGCCCCHCTRRGSSGVQPAQAHHGAVRGVAIVRSKRPKKAAAGTAKDTEEAVVASAPAATTPPASPRGGTTPSGTAQPGVFARAKAQAHAASARLLTTVNSSNSNSNGSGATPTAAAAAAGAAGKPSGGRMQLVKLLKNKKPAREVGPDPEAPLTKEEWTGPNIASDPNAAPDWIKNLQQQGSSSTAATVTSGLHSAATDYSTPAASGASAGGAGGLDWLNAAAAGAASAPALPPRPHTAAVGSSSSSGGVPSWMASAAAQGSDAPASGGLSWLTDAAAAVEQRPATAAGSGSYYGAVPGYSSPAAAGGARWGV